MALPPPLQSIVDFLRIGYPEGVPQQDYLPLFALLRRRLSDEEVAEVANDLAEQTSDQHTSEVIRSAIQHVLNETPSENDVDRVRDQFAAAGWETAVSR